MYLLTDKELAGRIIENLGNIDKEQPTTTKELMDGLHISAEELLPVGELNGLHHELMEQLSATGRYRILFSGERQYLPYKRPYIIEEIGDIKE